VIITYFKSDHLKYVSLFLTFVVHW